MTPYAVEFRYEEGIPSLLTGVKARQMAESLVSWATTILDAAAA
jgi:hypothetical protein